ncbi:ComEC family competence protein [Flavobacterium sp. CYK-4]|uniref:ComEC/Rec2 family competence protein n=1 Tax=Flavobacterium lotistagni TaxID=2709660 RepID=UPI0014089E95|nr:ComEC/Rec2 family competence protein [Flavobacterium lotistagni]NHM05828.1 ComEC family competence protein [Flavobacterium lotistagni]
MNAMQFPLTRVTIGFTFGILFANYTTFLATIVGFGCITFASIFFAFAFYRARKQFFQDHLFGIAVYLMSFCIGAATLMLHSATYQKSHYSKLISDSNTEHVAQIVLRERLKPTAYCERYIALVNDIDGTVSHGKLLVNCYKNGLKRPFKIGAELQIRGEILRPTAPLNPDQFDYGRYLKQKSILGQTYISSQNIKINPKYYRDIFYYADRLRCMILDNLQKHHFRKTELHVLAALILGQQQDIDPEVVQDYQFAGAVHILSVSGLHVGFVLLFMQFLLKWLPNSKRNSYFKLSFTLIALWSFAILAGLSPSVVRSATMFSFLTIGLQLNRQTNVLHTLMVSLLLILLFEPSFLFDVGFQLSYLALFFILWLQPLLSQIWHPENKIVNYFWQILTVSFAAQIGTLPLSLYYFHQFPGLFFITNMAVIPLLSIIMGLGVLLMAIAALGWVPNLLVRLVENLIWILNKIISSIASAEQLVWKDIPFNTLMTISSYLLIIAIALVVKKFSFKTMAMVLVAILFFQGSYFSSRWHSQAHDQWIVFNLRKKTLIIEKNANQVTAYTDADFTNNHPLNSYLTNQFCQLKAKKTIQKLMLFGQKKILIVDRLGQYPQKTSPDVMLFRDSPPVNLERVLKTCRPKILIADASNYKSYIALWKATCLKEKIPFHATDEKGFYRLEN